MRGWKALPVVLVLLFTASTSFAAGFRLPEAGAKAMGMGFAFTAQADDPSAIYFNPAGLTQLKGQNVMVGVTYVRENGADFLGTTPVDNNVPLTSGGFTNQKSETQKSLNFFIPNAYYTKTNASTGFSYGVGIFSPFGLGQEYNDKNTSIFRNQITKIDLQTIVVNPTIAFKVGDVLAVGAGIDWMYGRATLENTPWNPALAGLQHGNVFNLKLKGSGDAWGYNFGLLLKPTENLRIGANYRSAFTLRIKDGDVTLSNINPGVGTSFAGVSGTKAKCDPLDARHLRSRGLVHDGQADGERGRGLDLLAQLRQSADRFRERCPSGQERSQELERRLRPAGRGGISGDRSARPAGRVRLRPDAGAGGDGGTGAPRRDQD